MGGQNSGRQNITTEDWMRDMERRTMHEERRNQIRTSSDLLGPGIAPQAIQLTDWNDEATLFNGFYYSIPQAAPAHSPDDSKYWMGYNVVNIDGNGYQRIYEYRGEPDAATQVSYTRRFSSLAGTRAFEAWVLSGSGAGGGGSPLTVQDENVNIVTGATILDFQGSGISVAPGIAGEAVVTVPGGVAPAPDAGVAVMYDGTASANGTTSVAPAFVGLAGGAAGNFVAPASGKVLISVGGYLKSSVAGVYSHLTFEWTLVPSGQTIPAAGGTTTEAFSSQDTGYTKAVYQTLVSGLLPGGIYGIRTSIASGLATSTASAAGTRLIVTPQDANAGIGAPNRFGYTGVQANLAVGGAFNMPITFPAVPDTNYTVIINGNSVDVTFTVQSKTTTGCTIVARNKDAAVARDPGCYWEVVHEDGGGVASVGLCPGGYQFLTANSSVNAVGLITSAPTDVPGLSCSVVLAANRRYKVTFDGMVYGTVANDRAQVGLFDGATLINYTQATQMAVVTNGYGVHLEKILVGPTAGTHTIKVALGRQSGTGVINVLGTPPATPFISVEDIGPV